MHPQRRTQYTVIHIIRSTRFAEIDTHSFIPVFHLNDKTAFLYPLKPQTRYTTCPNMRKQFAYGICINPLGEIISVFSPVKLIHPHFRDIHRIRYRRIRHKPICPSKNQNTCNNSYNLPFRTLSLPTEKAKSADMIEFSRRRIPYLCNYVCAEITSGQR